MAVDVFAELDEKGKYIEVQFEYDYEAVVRIKKVPGRRWQPAMKVWRVPLDISAARILREQFGARLKLGAALTEWGERAVTQEKLLGALSSAPTANLVHMYDKVPELADTLKDFQRAGVVFASVSQHPLIADQPGLGKTLEAIGAVFESQNDLGMHLVIAPATSLDTVWKYELEKWQPHPVFMATGTAKQRQATIDEFLGSGPAWLIVNPDMVRFRKGPDGKPMSAYPALHATSWASIIIDECHKNAVRHPKTLTAKGMFALKLAHDGKRIALSGTPMGGREINLWGILHYLRPDVFTTKWGWADQWLDVVHNGYGYQIGGLRRGMEERFQAHLQPYMLRRTKEEVLKELPPKQRIDVWCDMSAKQSKQYKKFAKDAEVLVSRVNITDEEVMAALGGDKPTKAVVFASNILAEYTRLKQFANAYHEMLDGELVPTIDSGKLDALLDKLDELGIMDGEGEEQAVIFSQFSKVVDLVHDKLTEMGVKALKITGAVNKRGERADKQREFQAGDARVMVMTTTAGGVAITLDKASNVFILDETWDPDDQEQAEDRCHRASRIHQVTIYYLRAKGTIEEYIRETVSGKGSVNASVLDLTRQGKMKLYE